MRPSVLALCVLATTAAAGPLPLVVEFESSKGLSVGDPVRNGEDPIGRVTAVGFGDRDTVDVGLRIDEKSRSLVRSSSTFVIHGPTDREGAWVEHFVMDPASPPVADGARLAGARSVAEVWIRRGRVTSEELSRALSRGLDEFRRDLDELQRSEEWSKLRGQIAKLAAELTVTGAELSRLLEEQLPRLQEQLEDLYRRYQEELDRRRPDATGSAPPRSGQARNEPERVRQHLDDEEA